MKRIGNTLGTVVISNVIALISIVTTLCGILFSRTDNKVKPKMEMRILSLLIAGLALLAIFTGVVSAEYEVTKVWDSGSAIPGLVLSVNYADLDGDGEGEIITGGWGYFSEARIFECIGDNDYNLIWTEDLGDFYNRRLPAIRAIGDVDWDGNEELVIAGQRKVYFDWPTPQHVYYKGFWIYKSNSDNQYEKIWESLNSVDWEALNNPFTSVAIGDINNSGKNEIILGDMGGNIYIVIKSGDQYLWFPAFSVANFRDLTTGDVVGDGKDEIVTYSHEYFITEPIRPKIQVFEFSSGYSFSEVFEISGFGDSYDLPTIADADKDGKKEIIFTVKSGSEYKVNVFENDGFDSYTKVWESDPIVKGGKIAVNDTNNNGKEEIIVGGDKIYVFENIGDNLYTKVWDSGSTTGTIRSVTTGDADGDGKREIIVGSLDNKAYVFEVGVGLAPDLDLIISTPYNTFYQYTKLEVSDSIIIGAIVTESASEDTNIPSKADVKCEITKIGATDTFEPIIQSTNEMGITYFDLTELLSTGDYMLNFHAVADIANIGHFSKDVPVNIKVVETDLDIITTLTPMEGVADKWDYDNDGTPDDYTVKVNGKVQADISISSDQNLANVQVVFDPIKYYKYEGDTSVFSIGNLESGAYHTITSVFRVINGERYACTKVYPPSMREIQFNTYAEKVSPFIYLFFEDVDGELHRAWKRMDRKELNVFPYDETGPSLDIGTWAVDVEYDLLTNLGQDITSKVSEHMMNRLCGEMVGKLAGKGVTLAFPTYKLVNAIDMPPSKARENKITSSIFDYGAILTFAVAPQLGVGYFIASGTFMGGSILLDVHADELQRYEELSNECHNDMKPGDPLEDRGGADILVFVEEREEEVWSLSEWGTKYNKLEVTLVNLGLDDKSVTVQIESWDPYGQMGYNKYFDTTIINPASSETFILQLSASKWEHNSFIMRIYINEGEGLSKILTNIEGIALGVQKFQLEDKKGHKRSVFGADESINAHMSLTRNKLIDRKKIGFFDFDWMIIDSKGELKASGVEWRSECYDEDIEEGDDKTIIEHSWKLEEDLKPGNYTIKIEYYKWRILFKVKKIDIDIFRSDFIVLEEQQKISPIITVLHSILIEANITDNTGSSLSDSNVTACIERPDRITEILNLSEDVNGHYSVLYTNDTMPGAYFVTLTAEKEGYLRTFTRNIVNNQNKSEPFISNITISPSTPCTNQTFIISGVVKNNGTLTAKDVQISLENSSEIRLDDPTNNTIILGNISANSTTRFAWNATPLSSGTYYLSFIVKSNETISNNYVERIDVAPIPKHGISLSVDPQTVDVWTGDNASYLLYITNTGDTIDNITLNVSAPAGWNASMGISSFSLNYSETKSTFLTAIPPVDASYHESAYINLTSSSTIFAEINDTLTLECNVLPLISIIRITPDLMNITAKPNQMVTFNYTVKEIANKTSASWLRFNIAELQDENGTVIHSQYITFSNESFNLTKGSSKNISLTLDIPQNISAGVYKGIADVYGNNCSRDWAELKITVSQPPVANFTFSPSNPVINQMITSDASSSYDPDGFITNYEWDFGNGNITNTTTAIITHSYQLVGNYNVNLTVTDNDGLTNSTSKVVRIWSANVGLNVDQAQKTTTVGSNATYLLSLTNTGELFDNFTLTIDNLDNADVTLSEAVVGLAPNENATVFLNVTADSAGIHRVNITATSERDPTKFDYVNTTTKAELSNQPPNAPILVSPPDGSTTSDDTPTLSAHYSDSDAGDTGTTNYRISCSSLADCLNNVNIVASGTSAETTSNNEDTTWTPASSIGPNGTYYWCAQNNDGIDTSEWTGMGSFILEMVSGTHICDCAMLNITGETYYLTQDVNSTGTCMQIQANNITLDGQGHQITYSQSSTGYGIDNSGGYDNITIKNCTIVQFSSTSNSHGIYFNGATDGVIKNNNITTLGCCGRGIYLASSSNSNTLLNNTITTSGSIEVFGICLRSSSTNTLLNNTITTSGVYGCGIYFASSNSNTLLNNTITTSDSSGYGIYLDYSSTNTITRNKVKTNTYSIRSRGAGNEGANNIYNNLFNSTLGYTGTSLYTNNWNTTKQIGTRIHGNGTEIGGNYWTNPSGTGYSDTCTDTDKDGFCDNFYILATGNIDYLPLSDEYSPQNQPPVASFTYAPANPVVSQTVVFNASPSYDPDGSIDSYKWDFGDGNITNLTKDTTTHSYSSEGIYNVTLTVIDDDRAINSTTKQILANSPTLPIVVNRTSPACTIGSAYFSTIQDAVNTADDGNTIVVCPGAYTENVDVAKSLTIKSFSGNPADTIVNTSKPNDYVFAVYADYVNISGFTVRDATAMGGIGLFPADYCNITNNTISNNWIGIVADHTYYSTIINNSVISNTYNGIRLYDTDSCNVSNNNVSKNNYGIYLGVYSRKSTLMNNIASSNNYGIYLDSSTNNNILSNNASNNNYGIYLDSYLYPSSSNTLMNNTASYNDYGIYLDSCSGNIIYNNYFNNMDNAYDDGSNEWNITKTVGMNIIGGPYLGGNYWSDYTGEDMDGDWLGDTPYDIIGCSDKDYLPLVVRPDDSDPPASITNLTNTTGLTWINWTWTNPHDSDFNYTMVYLNGIWQTNTSHPFYNATNLINTIYEIGTQTVDKAGNINTAWVNRTAKINDENLTNWKYQTSLLIKENSGTTLTDYQVRVELNSSNYNFSKAKNDGSDIRFYFEVESKLHYWIEKWDAENEEAIVWVKIPSIPASGTTTIHMYYGNINANSMSNGDATFEFFDDFDGMTLDTNKWDTHLEGYGGSITMSDGKVRLASPSTWGENTAIISKSYFNINNTWDYVLSEQNQHSVYQGLSFPQGPWDTIYYRIIGKTGTSYYPQSHYRVSRGNGGNVIITDDDVYYLNTDVKVSLKRNETGAVVHDYMDSQGYILDWWIFGPDIGLPSTFAFFSRCNEGYQGWLDVHVVKVRKYADTEPTIKLNTQKGDLNGDGNITSADVQIVLIIAFEDRYTPEADVDENGYVNILDARIIMQAASGAISL